MNSLIIKVKVLPVDIEVNLDEMVKSITTKLPKTMSVMRSVEEPIAYGLVALVLDIKIPEEDGTMENLENAIHGSNLVSEIEVLGISRMSTKIG